MGESQYERMLREAKVQGWKNAAVVVLGSFLFMAAALYAMNAMVTRSARQLYDGCSAAYAGQGKVAIYEKCGVRP